MNDILVIDNVNAIEVFSGNGLDELLKKITSEVEGIVPDVSTFKGRKEIASLAAKVAKSKTYLDAAGKDLVSDWKTKSKAVDSERKKMRDRLDTLKEQVRKPLTDWEDTEKARVLLHEENITEIVDAGKVSISGWMELTLGSMKDRLKEIENDPINDKWEEFANDAAKAKDLTVSQIKEAIEKKEKHLSEQAELEKLRADKEAQLKKDHEESLRKEGEEKAKRDAEIKAKEASELADKEKNAAIEAKERAEREAVEAKESAKRKSELAAKAERDRIEQERVNAEAAAKSREADKKHRAKINNAAVDDLVTIGLTKAKAASVVTAIAKGQISHTRISY